MLTNRGTLLGGAPRGRAVGEGTGRTALPRGPVSGPTVMRLGSGLSLPVILTQGRSW